MPPSANSLPAFWRFLMRGGNALRPIKKDRWDWRQFFDADPQRPGKSYAPKAASLDADIQQFDPLVFGISPREAASLDPQQRLLLEVAWEAFEDAGIPQEQFSGSLTGVFVGGFMLDHLVLQTKESNRHLINAHSPGGVMMTVLSNRLSHALNLRGPSLTLDTACSSSLVALHYACQSLRLRECDMVLAGGVNVMTRPEFPIIMSKGHFLSDHGECHAFDETAAGYARGEGAGIFLLKRYEDAVAAGDSIHAVIRGAGVNQDGHTDGISLPNSEAQEALVERVYREAGVPYSQVDYIEAHGTGTQAGDSAELGALDRNFAQGRDRKLVVGSVKTNIGHLEAAAGVAGVLKAIGVLKNRQVPKNLHFKHPNPKIPFADYCLEVAKDTCLLPSVEEKPVLFVGVNSFGYGGTNAHILLESAPPASAPSEKKEELGLRLIPFSASSVEALRDMAGKFAFTLGQSPSVPITDLAYTTAFRRSHMPYRLAALAGTPEELRTQLIAASTGEPHESVAASAGATEGEPALAFVYTGMGPQWWAMGQELMSAEPIVAQTIEEIDTYFQPLAGWSLKEAMMAQEAASRMERTELAQPANFALQVALTRLWASYGIRPSAVVGHSVGEVVSAYVAGVYTLEEAVRVSYHRSRLQQTAAGKGAMLAVGLPEEEAEVLIAGVAGISIAAVNSFSAVTLSGDREPLEALAATLEKREIFNKFLRVEVAYHSPQMDPLREELLQCLGDLAPKPAQMPLYSTAYGKIVPVEDWGAEYWWHNVRNAVHFAAAMQAMFDDGCSTFLEVGPHPVLGNSIKECAAHLERKVRCFTSLRRKEPERQRMLLTLGELYCAGCNPDWNTISPPDGRFVAGPQYPWQRQHYWVESERSKMERLGLPGPVYLNRTVLGPRPCWEVEVNRNYFPFLFDHGVQDQTVFAGMGYIEAALSLSAKVHEKPAVVLENVSFEKVLVVDYAKLQYLITEFDAEAGRFSISSRTEGEENSVQRQCRGRLFPQSNPRPNTINLGIWKTKCAKSVTLEAFYANLQDRGLHYGPSFRPTSEIFVGDDSFFIKIDGRAVQDEESHALHPTIFDAAIQPILYCAVEEGLFVPFSINQFEYFSRPGAECFAVGRLTLQNKTMIAADVWLTDAAGNVHASARHISLQLIDIESPKSGANLFYESRWKLAPPEPMGEVEGADILIFADAEDSDMALASALLEKLAGAQLASGDFPEESLAGRRLVVLWGTGSPIRNAEAASLQNEKLIRLFQSAGRNAVEDITVVTSGAKATFEGATVPNLGSAAFGAVGLVAQNEYEPLFVRSLDLPTDDHEEAAVQVIAEIASRTRGDIAYRGGERFENVLEIFQEGEEPKKITTEPLDVPVELKLGTKGKIDSLHFELAERRAPERGEVEVRVQSAALNYKDVLKIGGHIHPLALENTFWGSDLGMECAGIVTRCGPESRFQIGDKIVAILPRAFRSYATIQEVFAVKIPENMGMEAAAVPVVFLTAFRGLVEIANLQRGERILIHNATGGLGLAAIVIARWAGAEIFATAGSEEKRHFLQRDCGVEHVYSSRELDFGTAIREVTGGEGIDVVIGAQTGQAQHASLNLLRMGGRFIEVGKKDISEDNSLPLRAFDRNLVFASVDIDRLAQERPDVIQRLMESVFGRFASGDFKLHTARTVHASKIGEAFSEMARSQHIGKLLVDFSFGTVEVPEPVKQVVKSDGCYIVTGGTSGFGVTTARWLAEQGAAKVILASRSGLKAPGIEDIISQVESSGSQVEVVSVDVTNAGQVRDLLAAAGSFPLRGIIHGAMVLDDAMMADLTPERFRRVFLTKVAGALNFAEALTGREGIDFLVFYSSISAVVGNPGQTNYVAANSTLDALAYDLRARGIPAVSINWGALAESGVVARDERLETVLSSAGITGLTNQQALDALEKAIRFSKPQIGAFLVDWKRWNESNPKLSDDPRFRDLRIRSQDGDANDAAAQTRRALADLSREQRLRALEGLLQEVLAMTLKMSKDTISVNRKLNEMGVDSLMVLELGLGIKESIGVNFSAMEFLKGPNLQQLAALAETKLWNNP